MSPRLRPVDRTLAILFAFCAVTSIGCNDQELYPIGPTIQQRSNERVSIPAGRVLGINANMGGFRPGAVPALHDLGIKYVRYDIPWWAWRDSTLGISWITSLVGQLTPTDSIESVVNLDYYVEPNQPAPVSGGFQQCTSLNNDWGGDSTKLANTWACVPTYGTTEWANYLADWEHFVSDMLSHFGPTIHYWSPWNEANLTAFFIGSSTQYDQMAKALCDSVHAYNGLHGTQDACVGPQVAFCSNACQASAQQWLQARVQNDAFDIAAVHIYRSMDPSSATSTIFSEAVDAIRAVIPATMKLWVTETGPAEIPAQAADPEIQEHDVVNKVRALANGQAQVDGIFLYDLFSPTSGLTDEFGYTRPAYYALKALLTGDYTDPPPGYCSQASGSAPCDYTTDLPGDTSYRGLITLRIVDLHDQPIPNAVAFAYDVRGNHLGDKKSDANGTMNFRVSDTTQYGIWLWALPPGISLPYGTNGQLIPPYYDGISTGTMQNRTRTFVLASQTPCSLNAHVIDQNSNPVANVGINFYSGATTYATVYSDPDGNAAYNQASCTGNYGMSTGAALAPPNVTVPNNFEYFDAILFSVDPEWGDIDPFYAPSPGRGWFGLRPPWMAARTFNVTVQ